MIKKYVKKALIAFLLILGLIWLLWGNLTVGLTTITLEEDGLPHAFDGYRIAHVSDLHNTHLWQKAIAQLRKAQPDIICITGDIVDSNHTDIDAALAFTAEAVMLAPCYYITGNHELLLDAAEYEKLTTTMKAQGVVVLDNASVIMEADGQQICVAGISWGSPYLGKLKEPDTYTVLLAHAPEDFESYASAGYDLVLSGHVHGGQFRVPFVGGLLAPGYGFLPEYDSGIYSNGNTDMIVSRGIGNSIIPVRFNNRPEVILVIL